MATLYISVYKSTTITTHGKPLQKLKVPIGVSSVPSAALVGDRTKRYTIRLVSDIDCQVERGENPGDTVTADANSEFFPANGVEYFSIKGGTTIAVIQL